MRAQITATTAVLVLLALASAGVIVYSIELQRVMQANTAAVEQELAEFAALQSDGVNPDTGEPFEDASQMIRLFLSRNVPDDDELLVGWWAGAPRVRSPSDDLTDDPSFRDKVTELAGEGGSRRLQIPERGEVLVTVQAVGTSNEEAALVVVTFLDRTRAGLRATMRTYAAVSLAALALITALAARQSGRLLAPLRSLRETAEEITGTDLHRRVPEVGNDDITALSRTVNGMLERLDSAFEGQRQFLDDAGHELRTPLTVLRGHLELLDAEDPADVAQTRDLLLDEVDRMARLVGDLTLLAKSRRPDFLTLAPTELDGLCRTVWAKAAALGPRSWLFDETAPVRAEVDQQRITQALLQLADNAVKHTGPGDVVAIGCARDAGGARLWVRDTGPGVPPEDREVVFERFGRSGDHHGGDEGFGLGLSIVRAIALAHGGDVQVEDPGDPSGDAADDVAGDGERTGRSGACFVITLPPDRMRG